MRTSRRAAPRPSPGTLIRRVADPNGQQQCSQQGPCSTCVELNSVVIEPTYAAGCAYVIQQCSLIPTRAKLGCFSLGTRCDMADCLSCAAADCGWCVAARPRAAPRIAHRR